MLKQSVYTWIIWTWDHNDQQQDAADHGSYSAWLFSVCVTLCVGEMTETGIKWIVLLLFQNKGVNHKETAKTHEQDDRGPTNTNSKDWGFSTQDNQGGRRDTPGIKLTIYVREQLGHREHMGSKTHTKQSTIVTHPPPPPPPPPPSRKVRPRTIETSKGEGRAGTTEVAQEECSKVRSVKGRGQGLARGDSGDLLFLRYKIKQVAHSAPRMLINSHGCLGFHSLCSLWLYPQPSPRARISTPSLSVFSTSPVALNRSLHANYYNQTQVFLILDLTHLLTAVSWVSLPLQTSLNHAPPRHIPPPPDSGREAWGITRNEPFVISRQPQERPHILFGLGSREGRNGCRLINLGTHLPMTQVEAQIPDPPNRTLLWVGR